MKKTLYQQAYVSLVLDTTIPAIYEEWMGSVSTAEFKKTLSKKLDLYIAYQKEYPDLKWLVNIKGLKVPEAGQSWANNEFHPQLAPNGVRRIAFVMPEDALYLLDNDQLLPHMDSAKQIELCYFDNLAEAKVWAKGVPQVEVS